MANRAISNYLSTKLFLFYGSHFKFAIPRISSRFDFQFSINQFSFVGNFVVVDVKGVFKFITCNFTRFNIHFAHIACKFSCYFTIFHHIFCSKSKRIVISADSCSPLAFNLLCKMYCGSQ